MAGIRDFLRRRWKGFLLFLAVAGPGIITSNVDNDAGGIATYSIAGSHFGLRLLWSLIPIMVEWIRHRVEKRRVAKAAV